jgi:arylformamidase
MSDVAIDPVQEEAFVTGQRRPHWPATIAALEAAGAAVATLPDFVADVAYGPHPRQHYDLLPGRGEVRGIVAYFHPGYWQMRDRTIGRCVLPVFANLGFDAATVGYPLAPEASVGEITEAVRAVVPSLLAEARRRHGRALPIVAAGHSAGAHLAVELATTDWAARGLAPPPIAALVGLSGVYDLEPLIATSLNAALRLDAESARAASPIHRVGHLGAPALFAVGAAETAAFRDQNARMGALWRGAGHAARTIESDGDDHFTLIERLIAPPSPLADAVRDLLGGLPTVSG